MIDANLELNLVAEKVGPIANTFAQFRHKADEQDRSWMSRSLMLRAAVQSCFPMDGLAIRRTHILQPQTGGSAMSKF